MTFAATRDDSGHASPGTLPGMPNSVRIPTTDLAPFLDTLLARAHAVKPKQSVRTVLAEMKRDLRVWAEADLIANDGITLQAADLIEYLVVFRGIPKEIVTLSLIRESMGIYRRRLHRGTRTTGGLRPKTHCKRGHPRTPNNVTAGGACRECGRDYERRKAAERRAAKGDLRNHV